MIIKKLEKHLLRAAYMDILRGYTKSNIKKFGTFYLKHLDLWSAEEIDERKIEYEDHAKSRGLPTEEEKIKEIEKDDLWGKEKENEIKNLHFQISNLKITKTKFVLKADIENIQEQINEAEKELIRLASERQDLVGYTVETFATKKINEFFIYTTSFKDPELKDPFFDKEEFDELHETDINSLVANYNVVSDLFNETNLKRMALCGFFLNSFYLCKDNPLILYGKPIINLTFNQNELFSLGRYFKGILSELKHEPDPEVMDDPDKLIELFNVGKSSEKIKEKMSESSATTVVGATQEDMKRMGLTSGQPDGAISLAKAAAEKGGYLDMEDLIKLHGE